MSVCKCQCYRCELIMSLCVYFSRVSGLAECVDRRGLPPGH
jgi:hypothetical protein